MLYKKAFGITAFIALLLAIIVIVLAYAMLIKSGLIAKWFGKLSTDDLTGQDTEQRNIGEMKSGIEQCYRLQSTQNPFPLQGADCGSYCVLGSSLDTSFDQTNYKVTWADQKIKADQHNCLQATLGRTSAGFIVTLVRATTCNACT